MGLCWRQPRQVVSVPAYSTPHALPAHCTSISPSPTPCTEFWGAKRPRGGPQVRRGGS